MTEPSSSPPWTCKTCGNTNHYIGIRNGCQECSDHHLAVMDELYPPRGGYGAL